MRCVFALAMLIALPFLGLSRDNDPPALVVRKATDKIQVDGELNEVSWKEAAVTSAFHQNFPFDTSLAKMQTESRVCFDDKFLYISGICYQPKNYIVQSLKRDYPNGSSDIFFVTIDAFRDKLNGFYFAVSPYNIQKEAQIFNGNDLTIAWDNTWYSAVKNYDTYWVVEMAIPFKTLRYRADSGGNAWNINFCRNNLLTNERSTWSPVPRNFNLLQLAFSGRLQWDEAPPAPGTNVTLIPYGAANLGRDFLKNTRSEGGLQAGGDAKVGITPSLNLDLTFNPDFAQVEADQQITNLSRFELFFPERRQFFIENSDLFGAFGLSSINPFFSRRIGLSRNLSTGGTVRVPILAGARLSGRLNKDWRMGLMNMQTGREEALGLPCTNFTVAAVQRRVFSRSNLGLMFVNRNDVYQQKDSSAFNRVLGLDYNLASSNGKWNGKVFYHRSFTPTKKENPFATAAVINYNSTRWTFENLVALVGENYQAETGFVPRRGIVRNAASVMYVFFPSGKMAKHINNIRVGPDWDVLYGSAAKRVTDWDAGLFGRVQFQSSAVFSFTLFRNDFTYLATPFDPTNTGGIPLMRGTQYRYLTNRISFSSNQRRNVYYSIQSRFGQYFNGTIQNVQTQLNFRLQPYGIVSLDASYTRISLPKPYSSANLWLLGPRFDMSLSRSVFFSTFVQYNNQINNLNINARFQWRFRPVSDFFIVYTDNYFASADAALPANALQPKNRAVVAKLTYWLNL